MIEINKKNVRIWSRLGPRGAFGKILTDLSTEREDFIVLSADLGQSSGLRRLMESSPERFINTGIAEQNLISTAAGIAREGIPVFATSFAPFITARACEQMRMDAAYMQLNVKAVGIGSGVSMGYLGNSHYGYEDIALMRALPDIVLLSPADGAEIAKCIEAALDYDGPVYLRLTGGNPLPVVHEEDFPLTIGKNIELRKGRDIALIATGSMVLPALGAAGLLEREGIDCAVVDAHTIRPLDEDNIRLLAQKVPFIVTVEEHSVNGGLGSAVAEIIASIRGGAVLKRLGLPVCYGKAAKYETLLEEYGLTETKIADMVAEWMNGFK